MSRLSIQQLVLLACLVAVAPDCQPQVTEAANVHEIAKRVDEHYNHLGSLRADFEERYQGAGVERAESGVLWLKRPGKMRWEYLQPRQKLFISDGKRAYFYVSGESQARRADVKKLDDLHSPLRYLLGKTRLEKEFEGLRLGPAGSMQSGNVVLVGRPVALADRVEEVRLEINPAFEIVRIEIIELGGSRTEFRFQRLNANLPAADNLFRFSPPAGVQIIESEGLTP